MGAGAGVTCISARQGLMIASRGNGIRLASFGALIMRFSNWFLSFFVFGTFVICGCGKDKEADAPAFKAREAPTFTTPASPTGTADLPPGHPPVTPGPAATQPATPAQAGTAGEDIVLTPPAEWVEQPARAMIARLFSVPKAAGDENDGEVTVSSLGAKVSLKMNIARWCGQFEIPQGDCLEKAQQRAVENTKYPTTIVELSGAYRGMNSQGPAKPGYIMLAAEIVTPGKQWYIKFVGPEKTVRHWEQSFNDFVSSAK